MSPDDRSAVPPRDSRGRLAVAVALLGAPFVAFPPDFITKALLDGGDDLVGNIPQLIYSGRKLLEGEIFWTPSLWMGQPLLAEPEFATFYLPKLLLLFGAPVVAYAVYVVLHYLAAELGAYLYLKSLGIGRLGSTFGALAFAYAGFMIGHRGHTMYVCAGAWTPFVLLAFDRATERRKGLSYFGASLTFAMVPLCGAVQLTVYLTGTLLFVSALRAWFDRQQKALLGTILCLVPGLLISAVQLVPSWDFTRQLATDTRADYALDVMHSFHPLLLPTLAFPVPPIDVELYSRAGVIVLCGVAVAFGRIRSAPTQVRAWAVVSAVALLMMFGGYFPLIMKVVHGLPVIGVLRGPARHNFELGLALSVLSAHGVDVAFRTGAGSIRRWLLAGAAFSAISWGMARLTQIVRVADAGAADLLEAIGPSALLGGVLAFGLWVAALAGRKSRWRRVLWAAVAIAPTLETAWAMRIEAEPNRSALGLFEAARAALSDAKRPVRLVSVSPRRGSVDALVGNSVLLVPGVESLQGYSSIPFDSPRDVLQLDMHGQPVFYEELSFSNLPSLFGVTHLVLPDLACSDDRFSIVPGRDLCARSPVRNHATPASSAIGSAELGCTALTTTTTFRYRLELSARAASKDTRSAWLLFRTPPQWKGRLGVELPGPMFGARQLERAEPVRLGDAQSWGFFWLANLRGGPVEFSRAGLFVDRAVTFAALGPLDGEGLSAEHAEMSADALRLNPSGGMALVERRLHWPRDVRPTNGVAVLEVEARAKSAPAGDLVVDLHGDSGYDPDDAEFVVRGSELGTIWRVFRTNIDIASAPEDLSLRVAATGSEPIEIREVRLARPFDERIYGYPITMNRYRDHARIEDGRITLEGRSRMEDGMHLPVRPFEILLDVESRQPFRGEVQFGLAVAPGYEIPTNWKLEPGEIGNHVRVHHVAVLPPDVRDARLFVRADGAVPLDVNQLSATDACTFRGYRNPRRLANGLFLYENPHALPRAYTVGQTAHADDRRSARRALLDLDPSRLGEIAIVGKAMPADLRRGSVERADFGQRSDDFVVRSDEGPTLLVVNERFDPAWNATIDGSPVAMFPTNALVRGVIVPKGEHRVHLEYRVPRSFFLGLFLSIAGMLGALFVAPALSRGRRFET